MTQINQEKIKKTAQEFFEMTGLPIEVEVAKFEEPTVPINLKMEEPQILIGERGQTLAEIQHLLKFILKKQMAIEGPFYVNLDINDYKKKKIEYLKETAKVLADEVALNKKEKYLPAMPAYERRIVHMELASREDIVTESSGQEPERCIVIRAHS